MQQYFVDINVHEGDIIALSDDILYHLVKVLRKDNNYKFRIADAMGNIYFANLINNKECKIGEPTNENNELNCDITCILSLIKNDKFELTIQKLVELGVKRIVPYESVRSVVKVKDNKKLTGGFGNVEVILEEFVDREQRFLVQRIDGALFENLGKEYLAQRSRELIDQTADTKILIVDNGLFRFKYFADLNGDLSLLERVGKLSEMSGNGTDADHCFQVKLIMQNTFHHFGGLHEVGYLGIFRDLLDYGNIVLVDVQNKGLLLICE